MNDNNKEINTASSAGSDKLSEVNTSSEEMTSGVKFSQTFSSASDTKAEPSTVETNSPTTGTTPTAPQPYSKPAENKQPPVSGGRAYTSTAYGAPNGNTYSYNAYAYNHHAPGSDFNTGGADYHTVNSAKTSAEGSRFYNTNINKKKPKKSVSLVAAIMAVIITAGASGFGAYYGTKLFEGTSQLKIEELAGSNPLNNQTPAIVAQPVADKDGTQLLTTPEIVDKVGPAVVGIINKGEVPSYGFGFGYGDDEIVEQGSGSGVIISKEGYIVTNNHVVENAKELTVILNTNEEYKAELIGTDPRTDLAVIKIEADNLTVATVGSSSDLRVGDTAIAIGNPLGQEFAGTTTQGIISGLNRSVVIDDKQLTLIQTDAAINPGNSGGALVNAYGQLIGINTAKISSSSLEGLGFAIPMDEATPIINDLIDKGYVTGRPIIGISGRAVTERDAEAYNLKVGVYVVSMTPESPAYKAGVEVGDIIVECEGQPVEEVEDINEIKNKLKPGDKITVKVYRHGDYKSLKIILGEEVPDTNQ